jgi:hypothetical protein
LRALAERLKVSRARCCFGSAFTAGADHRGPGLGLHGPKGWDAVVGTLYEPSPHHVLEHVRRALSRRTSEQIESKDSIEVFIARQPVIPSLDEPSSVVEESPALQDVR